MCLQLLEARRWQDLENYSYQHLEEQNAESYKAYFY